MRLLPLSRTSRTAVGRAPEGLTTTRMSGAEAPSHMVTSQMADRPSGLHASAPLSLSALRQASVPQLPRWAPRSGRTPAFTEWEYGLQRACFALGIDYSSLPVPAPTLSSVRRSSATRQAVREDADLDALFVREFSEWQRRNTELYFVVAPYWLRRLGRRMS